MTVEEVIGYLGRCKKPVSARIISEKIGLSIGSTRRSLNKLLLDKKVKYKSIKRKYGTEKHWRKN